MRKLVLILFVSLFTMSGLASHIVGGEMYYDHLGGNQYKITVKLYRDCLSTGAAYDPNLPVTVFNANGAQLDLFTIPFPGSTTLPIQFSNPCFTPPNDICIEEAIYTKTVTLPASPSGWILSYQRCCRAPAVTNLTDPGNTGLTLTVEIPPQTTVASNSSPRFKNFPPLILCTNDPLVFDHSAIDPDGDSLVYGLCTPYSGADDINPAPSSSSPPPYTPIIWGGGISASNPFGTGSISIDPVTGELIAAPAASGLYVVGVCVSEYRNGVLIGTNIRDFIFKVIVCDIQLAASIVQQPDLETFVSYCQGLTIEFENTSFGGTSYAWDFGVPGITTDVSTSFEPTYTYPAPGTYTVTMIVNPGSPCSDTASGVFTLNNEIEAFFDPPPVQCVLGNSFDFDGQGVFPTTGTTFQWDFGPDATPSTSTGQNPTNIVYGSQGLKNVSFKVMYDQCSAYHTEQVLVAAPPMINFGVPDEIRCAPYTVQFSNLSTASTQIYSFWDFGDGTTSSVTHPIHTYDQVGLYDVTLTIWTTSGCIDTLTMLRPNLIEVFPSPTSVFSITPYEQLEYGNEFQFFNESTDATESWFYFADGDFVNADSASHHYVDPGVYLPWQIVYNEYGCYDKSWGELKVIPILDIMVPNAFTPNGDKYNNVFQPVLFDDQVYELWIYNRWGEQVHYAHELNANWDGTYNGIAVPDGIYIWKMRYTSFEDEDTPVEVQGHVVVMK